MLTKEQIKLSNTEDVLALAVIILPGEDDLRPCVILSINELSESDDDLFRSALSITFYPNIVQAYYHLYDIAEDWAKYHHDERSETLLSQTLIWKHDDESQTPLLLDHKGTLIEPPYDIPYLAKLRSLWETCIQIDMKNIMCEIIRMVSNEELQKLLANMSTDDSMPYKNYSGADRNPYLSSDNSDDDYQFN